MAGVDDSNTGLFPVLNDGIYGDITFTVREIVRDLPQMVYASGNQLELPSFLAAVWSIVMRQYTESETVCFGFYSAAKPQDPSLSRHHICQVVMSPEMLVEELWRSRDEENKVSFINGGQRPHHNTAVYISQTLRCRRTRRPCSMNSSVHRIGVR